MSKTVLGFLIMAQVCLFGSFVAWAEHLSLDITLSGPMWLALSYLAGILLLLTLLIWAGQASYWNLMFRRASQHVAQQKNLENTVTEGSHI